MNVSLVSLVIATWLCAGTCFVSKTVLAPSKKGRPSEGTYTWGSCKLPGGSRKRRHSCIRMDLEMKC